MLMGLDILFLVKEVGDGGQEEVFQRSRSFKFAFIWVWFLELQDLSSFEILGLGSEVEISLEFGKFWSFRKVKINGFLGLQLLFGVRRYLKEEELGGEGAGEEGNIFLLMRS